MHFVQKKKQNISDGFHAHTQTRTYTHTMYMIMSMYEWGSYKTWTGLWTGFWTGLSVDLGNCAWFCAINLHGIIDGMIQSSRATHVCRSTGRGIKNCQIASVHTRTCIITYRGFKCLLPLAPSLASHLG